MFVRGLLLGTLVSAAALALSPAPVHAGTFSVSPLRVELSRKVQTGALTIRNRQDAQVVVEAQAMLWEQSDGEDRLTATRDVLVSPVVFTLPPNGSQLVRVALRRPPDAQRELSYRLILSEVPPRAEQGFTGLNVALRLSLPIFVEATAGAQPSLEWSATRGADDNLAVSARNAGGAHARVLHFSVAPFDAPDATIDEQVAAYILPGQAHTWMLDIHQKDGTSGTDSHRLRVKGATEASDFELEISPADR
jgi:fimbrial chaperone protein